MVAKATTIFPISNKGTNVTIDGGEGNDFIINYEDASLTAIYSGSGEDTIYNVADDITINSGADNDIVEILEGTNIVIQYAKGDGDDTIYGYDETDTINIMTKNQLSATIEGDDLIIGFKYYYGTMTLKDITDKIVNLQYTDGTIKTIKASNHIKVTADALDSYDNIAYYTNIILSNVSISAFAEVDNYLNNDGQSVVINAGTGNDTLYNYGKIQL